MITSIRLEFAPPSGKCVAIVGAGPAGLSAHIWPSSATRLLFEALPVAGGMLTVGIPEYRLPRDIMNSRSKPSRRPSGDPPQHQGGRGHNSGPA